MRFGVTIPNSGHLATARDLTRVAQAVEALGFDSVWVTDHVVLPLENDSVYPYSANGRVTWDTTIDWLDCFVALTWVAASTERVRLGTSVLVLPMRPALLVANMASSLEHLAPGRVILGMGSGWLREEFDLLGQSFEDRGRRMTEAIRLLRECWSPGPVEFEGEFHAGVPFFMEPSPEPERPIPVLIGGHSDAALRRVAEVGDGWHPTNQSPEQVTERLETLEGYLGEAGRAREDIRIVVRPGGSAKVSAAMVEAYQQAGTDGMVLDVDYRNQPLEDALADLRRLAAEVGLAT